MAKKLSESIEGGYSGIPHNVLDSLAFTGATIAAKALLFALIRQHNGKNNGHFQLADSWLNRQGFTSSSRYKARDELIERGLVIQTKWGGLHLGTNLYALTWLPLTNYVGLEISEGAFRRGEWARCELPPTSRRPKPKNKNQDDHYDDRNNTVTTTVIIDLLPTAATVTKTPQIAKSSTTTTVNNVVNTNTLYKTPRRTVGVKGRSGIKGVAHER
jgi:hypothetical protein